MKAKIKILIAEHDPIDLELMHNEFKASGIIYESEVVQNEHDYIKSLKQFAPDIIISDYTFPAFDGPTAFKIRENLAPDVPFIFLSGTIGEERSIELIKSGVTDYCLKDRLFTLNHKVLRALKESKDRLQKKEIEHSLIESQMRLARAEQVAHMGNWEWNFATDDVRWSDETFRIFGFNPGQDRQSFEYGLSFIHSEDRNLVLQEIMKSRNCLNDFSITYRIVQNGGAIRHVYMDAKVESDIEGKATGLYGIIHDVTAMVFLENKLAEERVTRQKEVTDAVLTAQETERAEIGKELHDNLSQVLGATKLYIELAKTEDEDRLMLLNKSSAYLGQVIEEIRKISKTLITPSLHPMGLFDCIKILKDDLSLATQMKILFLVEGITEGDLEEKLQLNIYRIIQEQLNNILKHAKATRATINLSRLDDEIILLISDNGRGYDTSKIRKGVGIRNIMSRVEFFHGRTEITSKRGKGYELKVGLPSVSVRKKSDLLSAQAV